MVVFCRMKCRIEYMFQDNVTEIFPNFDMASMGATIYIDNAGANDYSCGSGVHSNSE